MDRKTQIGLAALGALGIVALWQNREKAKKYTQVAINKFSHFVEGRRQKKISRIAA